MHLDVRTILVVNSVALAACVAALAVAADLHLTLNDLALASHPLQVGVADSEEGKDAVQHEDDDGGAKHGHGPA